MCQLVDMDYHNRAMKEIAKEGRKSPFAGALKFYKVFRVDDGKLHAFYRSNFIYSPGWNIPSESGMRFLKRPRVGKTTELSIIPTTPDMQRFNLYGGVFHARRAKSPVFPTPIYALPSHIAFLNADEVTLYAFYIKPQDYRRRLLLEGY